MWDLKHLTKVTSNIWTWAFIIGAKEASVHLKNPNCSITMSLSVSLTNLPRLENSRPGSVCENSTPSWSEECSKDWDHTRMFLFLGWHRKQYLFPFLGTGLSGISKKNRKKVLFSVQLKQELSGVNMHLTGFRSVNLGTFMRRDEFHVIR